MILLSILLLHACVYVYSLNSTCNVCIIDSICDDDYIHFNISVSSKCTNPTDLLYDYDTDINDEKHYGNTSIDCQNCYFDLAIDPIHDAWDYILTIQSPKSTKLCSVYTAHCGGKGSPILWYVVAGLSGLFTVLGAVLWIVRSCRTHQRKKTTEKKVPKAVVNA